MPGKKDAEYWRNYRAQRKGPPVGQEQAISPPPENPPEKLLEKKSRYDCGCEPGLLCISHGIQNMSQKRIDQILDRINFPTRKSGV